MNSLERLNAVLKNQTVDRTPNFDRMMSFAPNYIGKSLSRYYQD